MSDERITHYSLDELQRMRGETDWTRVAATTDAEIEAQIATDPDDVLLTDDELAHGRMVGPVIDPAERGEDVAPSTVAKIGAMFHRKR